MQRFRFAFAIVTALFTGCAGTPPVDNKELPPPITNERIEEIVVAPQTETGKESYKQSAWKLPRRSPFVIGEKVVLDVTYMGLPAGEISIEVPRLVKLNDRVAYHFRGHAKSSAIFSLFYTVDDTVESYVDAEKFLALKHEIKATESLRKQYRRVIFDHEKKKVSFYDRLIKRKDPLRIREFETDLEYEAIDAFSSLFWVRSQKLKVGESYKYHIYDNGKTWLLEAKVLRKEKLKTAIGEFDTLVIQPYTYFRGVLKQKGEIYVWVTDDERKIPLKLQSKLKIGSIVGSVQNLRLGMKDVARR